MKLKSLFIQIMRIKTIMKFITMFTKLYIKLKISNKLKNLKRIEKAETITKT